MTSARDVCVLHWYAQWPYALTVVGVPASRAIEADRKALAALGDLTFPSAWHAAPRELRRRVVRECRWIPTVGARHLFDDRPSADEADSWHQVFARMDDEWYSPGLSRGTQEIVLDTAPPVQLPPVPRNVAADGWPGLRALTRLTALVCRMPLDIWLDDDEDLLNIFDQYSVGALVDEDFFDYPLERRARTEEDRQ